MKAAPAVHAAPMMHAAPHFNAAPRVNVAPRMNVAPRHVFVPHNAPTLQRRVITGQPKHIGVVQQHNLNQGAIQQRHLHGTIRQVQPTIKTQPGTASIRSADRHLRANGQPRLDPKIARQGRFSGPFLARGTARTRGAWIAPHRAWRGHHRAHFVPWYGPVFWPYAYSDIFDYTFWPYGYDDGYWFYAYDDFFDGVFWGEVGPPDEYAYEPGTGTAPAPRPSYAGVEELCKQPGTGITAWPIAEIESKVGLNADQKKLLADLRASASKAADVFKNSCPSDNAFPLTPPGRLQTMTARLQATLEAVQTVRPALEAFYNSLSDEQKERFNQIGPQKPTASAEAQAALPDEAKACSEAKPGLTNLPIDEIQDAVKPTAEQQADLDKLGEATVKAVGILQAACPQEMPITPPGRLEAIEKRLQAMIEAANTVKAPLDSFYASLSNEQKARFNRMGRQLSQTNG